MATLTLRLPNGLDRQLTLLAAQTHQNRSELARAALEKFLHDQAREQLLAGMAEAFHFLASDSAARAHSLALAEEFQPLDAEVLAHAEGRDATEIEAQWWR